jgi:hypothetical protein
LEIKCDKNDADKLLLLASKVYPEAVQYIARAIMSAAEVGLGVSNTQLARYIEPATLT